MREDFGDLKITWRKVLIGFAIIVGASAIATHVRLPTSSPVLKDTPVLFCHSIELYDRFAGDFDNYIHSVHPESWPQEFINNFGGEGPCTFFFDEANATPKVYHLEKREQNYVCILPFGVDNDKCLWSDANKLRYLGHGQQQSDEQFAQRPNGGNGLQKVVRSLQRRGNSTTRQMPTSSGCGNWSSVTVDYFVSMLSKPARPTNLSA